MKYCTKCGRQLVEEARFCNACGAPVDANVTQPESSENPYASKATYTAPQYTAQPAVQVNKPKTDDELRAEEQALLDKFSLGLKHERLAWKISGIFFLIGSIFFIVIGLIFGIAAIGAYDMAADEYALFAYIFFTYTLVGVFVYLPITITNLCMKKKLESYRDKLYTDCKDGVNHYSVGSIVFAAFFNTIAMVFIIVYFVQAKNNSQVIERIKSRQDSYNSQL